MNAGLHRQITKNALHKELPELGKREVRLIVRGNLAVDYLGYFRYKRQFHVDRVPYAPHEDAWEMGLLAIKERKAQISRFASSGKKRRMYRMVGALLHTLQDFFSHTNYTDLGVDGRIDFLERLLGEEHMPETIQICAFGILDFLRDQKDPYHHSTHHHDAGDTIIIKGAFRASCETLSRLRETVISTQ